MEKLSITLAARSFALSARAEAGCFGRAQLCAATVGALRQGYAPAVAQVAAVANASTAPTNIAVSNLDRAHMWITPRFHQNYSNS
jgi:hypothetical protein